jgi:predicted dehydrogenase
MTTIHFRIIGCGLMGRELASAMARWLHLAEMDTRAELVAVCDRNDERRRWLAERVPSVRQSTADYRELLANPGVEAVYCAVPQPAGLYCAIIGAGKHLLGEKPFGIDRAASDAILACAAEHPGRSSARRFCYPPPSGPGDDRSGRVRPGHREHGFHSSDLDPDLTLTGSAWSRSTANTV